MSRRRRQRLGPRRHERTCTTWNTTRCVSWSRWCKGANRGGRTAVKVHDRRRHVRKGTERGHASKSTPGRERDLADLTESHQVTARQIEERFRTESVAAEAEFNETRKQINIRVRRGRAKGTRHQPGQSRWTAESVYEAAEKQSTDDRDEIRRNAAATADRLAELWRQAEGPLARAGLERDEVEVPLSDAAGGLIVDPARAIEEQFAVAEQVLARIARFANAEAGQRRRVLRLSIPHRHRGRGAVAARAQRKDPGGRRWR